MAGGKSNKRIIDSGKHFIFREYVSNERKLKIEKHPQSDEYFRFKSAGSMWKWFVSSNAHHLNKSKYVTNNKVTYELDSDKTN